MACPLLACPVAGLIQQSFIQCASRPRSQEASVQRRCQVRLSSSLSLSSLPLSLLVLHTYTYTHPLQLCQSRRHLSSSLTSAAVMAARFTPRLFQVGIRLVHRTCAIPSSSTLGKRFFISMGVAPLSDRLPSQIGCHVWPHISSPTQNPPQICLVSLSPILTRTSHSCSLHPPSPIISSTLSSPSQQATRGYASQATVRAPRQLEGLAGRFSPSFFVASPRSHNTHR